MVFSFGILILLFAFGFLFLFIRELGQFRNFSHSSNLERSLFSFCPRKVTTLIRFNFTGREKFNLPKHKKIREQTGFNIGEKLLRKLG